MFKKIDDILETFIRELKSTESLEINLYLSNKICVILNLFSMASASNLKFFKT